MMGIPLSPEDQQRLNETVAKRKAEVRASLGDKATGEGEREHHHEDAHLDDDLLPQERAVSEDDVLAYVRETKELADRARGRVRELRAQIKHLNFQIELEKKKNAALRDAIAKMRAQLKDAQAAGEEAGAKGE